MYLLIDTTNWIVIARHKHHTALQALHFIQFANVDAVVLGAGTNRAWARFQAEELDKLYVNGGAGQIVAHDETYTAKIRKVREHFENAAYLELPFSVDDLNAQAHHVDMKDVRPMAFAPGCADPTVLERWSFPPNVPRARKDSTFALTFSVGNGGHPPPLIEPATASRAARTTAPPPPPGSAPPPPARRSRSAAPAVPRAPREPREPGAPAGRPKPGSTTGKVWDIADRLADSFSGKELRREVLKECEKQGINASTGSVQFGKWSSARR